MKTIVLITTGHPSLNPRLVKEADTLSDAGYNVTVLYAYWNKWGAEFDKGLIASKKWKAQCIGGDPELKKATYFVSKAIHNIALIINKKSNGKYLSDVAISRSSFFLKRAAQKNKADLYIGHNLGALPAAVAAAKSKKQLCGFDAEDFHRNEMSNDKNDPDVLLKARLEDQYYPRLDYLSTSSCAIATAYKDLFPGIVPTVLLNVFPSVTNIPSPVFNAESPIKLFWFSQTIGIKRGLEDIADALQLLTDYSFELHLLGHLPAQTKDDYINKLFEDNGSNVYFHPPIAPDALPVFASQFDIGLALEPAFSQNNDFALSNKIFTYLQSGLAIAASDTKAQHQLLSEYPGIGESYHKGNAQQLADILLFFHQHRDKLFETRKAALQAANNDLNWENESKKFLTLIYQTLIRN